MVAYKYCNDRYICKDFFHGFAAQNCSSFTFFEGLRTWDPQNVILYCVHIRKIRLIESNGKCRYLKKLTCKGTLRQVFICLRPPPLLGFCLGWSSNFVVLNLVRNRVLNSCRMWSPTQLNTPHPLSATHCLYVLYFHFWEGGGVGGRWTREKVRGGNSSQSWVKNTNMTDCISRH